MKTQITKTLHLSDGDYNVAGGVTGLCGSFVQAFFPNQELPANVKVTVTNRKRAFKDAKPIFVRHQVLGYTGPSSWTWEMTGTTPTGYATGGGMFHSAQNAVKELLGDKLAKLPNFATHNIAGFPLYVRVVKI